MERILWTSRSAMIATSDKIDVISNNLANENTDGYTFFILLYRGHLPLCQGYHPYPL